MAASSVSAKLEDQAGVSGTTEGLCQFFLETSTAQLLLDHNADPNAKPGD